MKQFLSATAVVLAVSLHLVAQSPAPGAGTSTEPAPRRPDGKPEKREVKPGRSNDHFVEVDGLKEGEEVQLFVPTEGSSGASK